MWACLDWVWSLSRMKSLFECRKLPPSSGMAIPFDVTSGGTWKLQPFFLSLVFGTQHCLFLSDVLTGVQEHLRVVLCASLWLMFSFALCTFTGNGWSCLFHVFWSLFSSYWIWDGVFCVPGLCCCCSAGISSWSCLSFHPCKVQCVCSSFIDCGFTIEFKILKLFSYIFSWNVVLHLHLHPVKFEFTFR